MKVTTEMKKLAYRRMVWYQNNHLTITPEYGITPFVVPEIRVLASEIFRKIREGFFNNKGYSRSLINYNHPRFRRSI